MINIGDTVKIISFHGSKAAPDNVEDNENYWQLINGIGKVVEKRAFHPYYKNKGSQALVKLEENLVNFGIESHNKEDNSLWFFVSDLRKI